MTRNHAEMFDKITATTETAIASHGPGLNKRTPDAAGGEPMAEGESLTPPNAQNVKSAGKATHEAPSPVGGSEPQPAQRRGGVSLVPHKFPLTPPKQKCETSCERSLFPGRLGPDACSGQAQSSSRQGLPSFQPRSLKLMKFAKSIRLVGSHGVISNIHADFAKRLIQAGKGRPIREGKTVVEVQLPSVPCGERDLAFHGGNSSRQHRVEVCNGGAEVKIETETTLPRVAVTQSCRVFALKHSSRVLGEVLSAERAELRA